MAPSSLFPRFRSSTSSWAWWDWRGSGPVGFLAGSGLHRSIEARLIIYPISALVALLIYQGTNAGLYYIIGMMAYFWAYSEGEVVCPEPWTLPKRGSTRRGV
ncbi:uncharacterized protein N0V89_002817 [Didymosphaeria variabile]|uniref:DUF7727 domain-containing protein n=1 Tax=Didymosphaeria variabile TaxID=1932322 RepID=A0A9W9CER1_9PLEO|nr:uncharacterized protein N0V89_002817 [Didymosphaeria variabile]KAJ4358237.1 hypothetical protein N0V89_002817 [Didymosphaeria variabile]